MTEATARDVSTCRRTWRESRPEAIGVPIPGGDFELAPADGADPASASWSTGARTSFGYAWEPADPAQPGGRGAGHR
ncbi:hypothetical protein HBB16_16115 [Pseudonocardia sp. MCCB 268]|nr:hypothetical protein [Pseudonocardia cytotoxica]